MSCLVPFYTLQMTPTGFQGCCYHNMPIIEGMTKEEFWNSEYMQGLRTELLTGNYNDICRECLQIDSTGHHLPGMAQHDNPELKAIMPFEPKLVNFFVTNKCNFACRTCTPYLSDTQGRFRENKLGIECSDAGRTYRELDFIKEIGKLDTVERFTLCGGDPMQDPIWLDAIRSIEDKTKAITVIWNGSVYNEEMVDEIKKFNDVLLSVSIDGDTRTSEYMRVFSKQQTIFKNMRRAMDDGIKLHITYTLSNINVWCFSEFFEEMVREMGPERLPFMTLSWNYANNPSKFKISNIPHRLRPKLIAKWQKDAAEVGQLMRKPQNHWIQQTEFLQNFMHGVKWAGSLLTLWEPNEDEWNDNIEYNELHDRNLRSGESIIGMFK